MKQDRMQDIIDEVYNKRKSTPNFLIADTCVLRQIAEEIIEECAEIQELGGDIRTHFLLSN